MYKVFKINMQKFIFDTKFTNMNFFADYKIGLLNMKSYICTYMLMNEWAKKIN